MSPKLQEKLFKAFPAYFARRHLSKRESCMYFGVTCGDGWFDILRQMCEKLEEAKIDLEFEQIKEKFGILRVYTDPEPEPLADDIIMWATNLSCKTCEECGKKGRLRTGGWLKMRCADCHYAELKRIKNGN